MIGTLETMHEHLTKLMMDNGAAVTKQSIDALIKFIAARDVTTINAAVSDLDRLKQKLNEDSGIHTLATPTAPGEKQ